MRTRSAWLCAVTAVGALLVVGCAPGPVTKYDVAKGQQEKKEYSAAISSYNQFMTDPANANSTLLPYALYNVAWSYRGMYDQEGAMKAYTQLTQQFPASDPAKWAASEMRDLQQNPLKKPTTTTLKPTTTTVKVTTTTVKATTTTAKPVTTTVKVTTTTVKAPVTTTTMKPVAK